MTQFRHVNVFQTCRQDVGKMAFGTFHRKLRFHVINDEALMACGVTQDEIESYVTIISHFNGIMGKDYGVSGGGQAFVNLDKLKYFSKKSLKGTNKIQQFVCVPNIKSIILRTGYNYVRLYNCVILKILL